MQGRGSDRAQRKSCEQLTLRRIASLVVLGEVFEDVVLDPWPPIIGLLLILLLCPFHVVGLSDSWKLKSSLYKL